jgi:DNA-binding transcriptional MerR regulator
MAVQDEQALLVVEDLADLLSLAQQRAADRALHAAIWRMAQRHERGPRPSAVRLSTAAKLLNVTVPTVRSWISHGVLDPAGGEGVARVSATSLARVLVVLREIGEDEPGRRLARVIDALRDRDLLNRAQEVLAETTEYVEYSDDDLEELLRP